MMSAPTETPVAVHEAAALATSLLTRTLKLAERAIADQEQSPTATLKDHAATIAMVKRAADTLKTLAALQAKPAATTAEPSSSSKVPAPVPAPSSPLPAEVPLPPAPRKPMPPQAPTTRRYGEMLARR